MPRPATSATQPPPRPAGRVERRRLRLRDGAATTIHLLRMPAATTRARVVAMPEPLQLLSWCALSGVGDAVVGGFFIRSAGTPLGELWSDGTALASEPFDSPWDGVRSCVGVERGALRVGRREALPEKPAGDLLQAGPLLVRDGAKAHLDGEDPEGFSAGSRQFDSDITIGRYPRAALALTGTEIVAAVCDGRTSEDSGLTLEELAETLIGLGARDAINLDGGGSASLVAAGHLLNSPREEHGIAIPGGRPISTALAFEPV